MFLRAAVLIEGLRLDGDLHVGGVRVAPIALEHGFAGRELREPLNSLLAEHGFVSVFGRPIWAAQIGPRRRLSFAVAPAIEVPEIVGASREASTRLAQLIDALNVTHGGAPRVFAEVHEQSDDGSTWRAFALMVGGGTRPGSVLERVIPQDDRLVSIEPLDLWTRAMADSLISLWQSLYRGIAGEQQWDVRVLRCCSLLEAIGRERLHHKAAVRDAAGRRLLDEQGKPATTKTLRGKLYTLVNHAVGSAVTSPRALLCHDSRSLWDEVGVWADVAQHGRPRRSLETAPAPEHAPGGAAPFSGCLRAGRPWRRPRSRLAALHRRRECGNRSGAARDRPPAGLPSAHLGRAGERYSSPNGVINHKGYCLSRADPGSRGGPSPGE